MTYTRDGHGRIVDAISRDLALLHERRFGTAPSAVKTIWTDDVVVVLMRQVLTSGEKHLCEAGKFDDVRRRRSAASDEGAPLLEGIVEGLTGHTVRDFLSQVSSEDEATYLFVLGGGRRSAEHPDPDGDRHASSRG
ncbi:MAG TPA: Na-translocating system protein MpsC family protein [Solirubrobacterales bacterium]|nr:Na-translocating system protein MpsC family protein [Solirubrobacterales bacterium]